MQKSNLFSNFTNKYSLSKTIRFELVPVGNTKKLLEEDKVFEKDELIQEKYHATKPFFDKLHRDFVNEALENVSLPLLSDYYEIFIKWKGDKKSHEKSLQIIETNLRQELVFIFNDQAKRWADKYSNLLIKNKDIDLLFEESIFAILKARYGQDEGSEIIDINYDIPDIISYIQRETELTRKTICDILLKSGRIEDVKINPQLFLDQVVRIIQEELNKLIIDGIKYEKIDGQEYEMSLFKDEEIIEEMRRIAESEKSPYKLMKLDSEVEKTYANRLNEDDKVKFFIKMPKWFKINTPIGSYNPDWAILKEDNGLKLYLVRETKGDLTDGNLRVSEKTKIDCAKKHFEALGVDYKDIEPPFMTIN